MCCHVLYYSNTTLPRVFGEDPLEGSPKLFVEDRVDDRVEG